MKSILSALQRFANDEDGVTAIEYGLIAALIGIATVAIMTQVGGKLVDKFGEVKAALTTPA